MSWAWLSDTMMVRVHDDNGLYPGTYISVSDTDRLLPTDDLNTGNFTISQSPFTIVFTEGKLGDVANVMNSIILITVRSACGIS